MPDFSTYAWNQLSPATTPPARHAHAMVWDGSRIIMFGGYGTTILAKLDDTWEFNGTDWTDLSPATTPTARGNHTMVWTGSEVLMFGGYKDPAGTLTNELWSFDGSDWTNVTPGTSPSARLRAHMVWDGSKVIMYGGDAGGGVVKKDTWKYESGAWTQLTPTNYIENIRHVAPGFGQDGRGNIPFVWDGSRVLGFSGYSDAGGGGEFQTYPYYETDGGTWQYESSDWSQVAPATNPAARHGQGFCVTDDDQKILMYGGNVSSVGGFGNFYSSETWEFDGTDWNQLVVASPDGRQVPMVWDDGSARALIFGGQGDIGGSDDVATDETWEFATGSPPETYYEINHPFGLG